MKFKKVISSVLLTALALPVFTGCQTASPAPAAGGETGGKELITPTYFFGTPSYLYTGDELVFKAIEQAQNIKFKVIPVPLASYTEKLSTTLASNEIPDLMSLRSSATSDQYGPQGAFVELNKYMDDKKMPNFVKMMDAYPPANALIKAPNGKVYGAPRIYDMDFRMDQTWLARVDILEKNNIAMPKTFDDLYNVMKKLKEIYPDSTPYTNRWGIGHLISGQAYFRNAPVGIGIDLDENKYIFGPATEGYKEALLFLKSAYKDGLLDKDFATLSDEQWTEKFATGKAFLTFDYPQAGDETIATNGSQLEPGWNFMSIVQPEYNGKRYGTPVLKGYYGCVRVISSKSKHIDRLVEFIDWSYSPEGVDAFMFGIEGESFTRDANGKAQLNSDIKYPANPSGTIDNHGLNEQNLFSVLSSEARDIYELNGQQMAKSTKVIKDNKAYGEPTYSAKFASDADRKKYNDLVTPINTYIEEASMKVIIGELDIAKWESDVLKTVEGMGLQEALDMINKAYVDTFNR